MEIRKKKVGHVTPEECAEILTLFERRNGLIELSMILTHDNEELSEKYKKDFSETKTQFDNWWHQMSKKYKWESAPNGKWVIDFDTRDIYLELS